MPSLTVVSRTLIIFARAPALGTVKTRLAADLGPERALRIYRYMGEHALRAGIGVSDCLCVVHFTPSDALGAIQEWLEPPSLCAQSGGDLGERMSSAVGTALADGAERVVVIGTDCPSIETSLLEEAFATLDEADLVIGPALDGGYYLIGMSRLHPVFRGIPWSASDTLSETLRLAAQARLTVALLQPLADIDTLLDWERWLDLLSAERREEVIRLDLDPARGF